MQELSNHERAVELLQQLGLQEYEAKAFVALTRVPHGTAKEISEISEVPRTRVYDAVRVLETKGLVEIQHSNPQEFRAVSIDEAADTLRHEYELRTKTLRETLQAVEPAPVKNETEVTHEVWALSGTAGITSRTQQLLTDATEELVLIIGDDSVITEKLVSNLKTVQKRGVTVVVGTTTNAVRETIQQKLPDAKVFVSGLEWLSGSVQPGDDTKISRLLLVDRTTILVSTFYNSVEGEPKQEQAVFGRGFNNGLVTIVRRLLATGLIPSDDPGTS